MARISDVPYAFRSLGFKGLAGKVWKEISEDAIFTWASALAYSWVFALFPLVIAILTLAPYLPGQTKDDARNRIGQSIEQAGISGDAGKAVNDSIEEVVKNTQGGLLSLGLFLALWSASGGMAMTMTALDKCYEVKTERSWFMQRLVALGLTFATIVLILVVMVLLPIGGAITNYFENKGILGPVAAIVIDVLRYVLSLGLLFAVVALMYYFGPNIKQRWHAVTPGAILAVVVWILVGIGFGIYVANFANFNKTYGALGAGIALLLFFYLSSAILLIGAEVNSVIDFAVLKVEPGTRDFTGAMLRQDAIQPARDEDDVALENAPDFRPDTVPARAAPAGWWKWAAASMAMGWVAKKAAGGPRTS